MSEYNIQMNKYNALNAGYDQLFPATKIENVDGLDTALQNKAPAGYGLGTVGKRLYSSDDLNTIWKSGFYSWGGSDKPTNFIEHAPSAFWVSAMEVISYGDGGVNIQRVWGLDTESAPILVQRVKYVNTIRPWEYVNPPMEPGEEYRTTERYLGKPVYKKLIEFPSLTGHDYVYVYSRYGYVFHAFGEVETQYDNPDIAGTKYWNTIFPETTAPTDDNVFISLTNNYSVQVGVMLSKGTDSAYYGKKARVQVWYYKPAD